MIIVRLFEDAVIVGRFAWFYYRAPSENRHIGFTGGDDKMPVRARAAWAWKRTTTL